MRKVFFDLPKGLILLTLLFAFLTQLFDAFWGVLLTFSALSLLSLYVGGVLSFNKTINVKLIGYGLFTYGLLQTFLESMNSGSPLAITFGFVMFLSGLFSLVVMMIVELARYFEIHVSIGDKKKPPKESK